MLGTGTMSRTALALVMVAASATTASAGGYVGLGIGTSPAVSSDMSFNESERSGRLQLGYRFGHFAIEGLGSRATVVSQYGAPYDWTSLAIAGRVNFELGDRFELLGRIGLQQSSFDLQDSDDDYEGDGLLFGAGVEYRLTVGGIGVSAIVDYTISRSDLTNSSRQGVWDATSRVWTLGGLLYF